MAKTQDEAPTLLFETSADWRAWLDANYTNTQGIWMRIARKGCKTLSSIDYAQALDQALCYGWIDGQRRSLDEESFVQRFTPRRARSIWSKVNREHIQRLTDLGLMHAAGFAEVQRAKDDGRWDAAYDSFSTIQVPADFQAALEANPSALAFFQTLKGQQRYAFLFRLQLVKKAETRARKIAAYIEALAQGQLI